MKIAVWLLAMLLFSRTVSTPLTTQHSTADAASVSDIDAKQAFARFRQLVGHFRTVEEPEDAARVVYELWSRDTALMEQWHMADGTKEFTVFSMDGDDFIATHFCAIGVQSTMQLQMPVTNGRYEFKIVAARNLPNPGAMHNSGFSYTFHDDGSITRREYWTKKGEISESLLEIVREETD